MRAGLSCENNAQTERSSVTLWAGMLFTMLLSVYVITMSGHHYSVDGMAMYQQAKPLLFHGSFKFSPPFRWHAYVTPYTYWSEGLSIVYMVPLAVFAFLVFPDNPSFRVMPATEVQLLNDPSFRFVGLTNAALTALTACALFLIATRLGMRRRTAAAMTLVYGLASPALAYQKEDFAQPLATLLVVAAVLLYLRATDARPGWRGKLWMWAVGLCVGFLVTTRSESLLIVAPVFVALAVLRARALPGSRDKVATVAAILIPLIAFVGFHLYVNHVKEGQVLALRGAFKFDLAAWLRGLTGSLASPGRGFVTFFPLALFAPRGLRRMWVGGLRMPALTFGALIVLHVMLFAGWPCWWGGVSWGPRFLVPILPIATLLAFWQHPVGETGCRVWRCFSGSTMAAAVLLGLAMSLTGTLLRWDYNAAQRAAECGFPDYDAPSGRGSWCFRIESNPLHANWRDLGHPSRYDLLLLQPSTRQSPAWKIMFAGAFVSLAVSGMVLAHCLLRGKPTDVAARGSIDPRLSHL